MILYLDIDRNIVIINCLRMMMLILIKQHPSNTQATFEAQFMKKLCNTEAGLKKNVAYKKSVYL